MIAPALLPKPYAEWNRRHGAPYGRELFFPKWMRRLMSEECLKYRRGPFAFQPNNSIRAFEYPWAFEKGGLKAGMKVLEIGGGLSGFQFVVDRAGCQVVNVDPGMPAAGWPCDQKSMHKLNRRFGTQVELRQTTMENAQLPGDSFDRAFCISVVEHLSPSEAAQTLRQVHRCLKAGGLFILTADLFLNVQPFCSRKSNEHGINMDIKTMIEAGSWELIFGERKCLYGFPEFSADFVLANLADYFIGQYPALAQCFVLAKR